MSLCNFRETASAVWKLKTTTMTTIETHGLKPFFEFKDFMRSKGFTYIENQKIKASHETNYFAIDEFGLYSLISKEDYETLNNSKK